MFRMEAHPMSDDTRDPRKGAPRRQKGHAVLPAGKRPAPEPGTVRQKGHAVLTAEQQAANAQRKPGTVRQKGRPVLPTPHTAG